ncbi:MAG: transposase [Nocardioidaceae bacterium]
MFPADLAHGPRRLAAGAATTVRRWHRAGRVGPVSWYANAIRDELPDAVAVLDAFHVVRLGTAVVDEVRRRVQQDTVGHRGFAAGGEASLAPFATGPDTS